MLRIKEKQWLQDMSIIHTILVNTKEQRLNEIKQQESFLEKWLETKCGSWHLGEIAGIVQQLHYAGWLFPPLPSTTIVDEFCISRHWKFIEKWLRKRYCPEHTTSHFDKPPKSTSEWIQDSIYGGVQDQYYENFIEKLNDHELIRGNKRLKDNGKCIVAGDDVSWTFTMSGEFITMWCPYVVQCHPSTTSINEEQNLMYQMQWSKLQESTQTILKKSTGLLPPLIDIIVSFWLGIA